MNICSRFLESSALRRSVGLLIKRIAGLMFYVTTLTRTVRPLMKTITPLTKRSRRRDLRRHGTAEDHHRRDEMHHEPAIFCQSADGLRHAADGRLHLNVHVAHQAVHI